METPHIQQDSPSWYLFVIVGFLIPIVFTAVGIWEMPVNLWIRGFLGMGFFFSVCSTFTLSKTMRDKHESEKLIKRIANAKTTQLISKYEDQ